MWPIPPPASPHRKKNSSYIKLNLPCFMPIFFHPPTAYTVENLTGRGEGCWAFLSAAKASSLKLSSQLKVPWSLTLLSWWPYSELTPIYPHLSSTEVGMEVQNSTCSLTAVDQRRWSLPLTFLLIWPSIDLPCLQMKDSWRQGTCWLIPSLLSVRTPGAFSESWSPDSQLPACVFARNCTKSWFRAL